MPPDAVEFLLSRGRLERVEPSVTSAGFLVAEARRHVVSAGTLAETDPSMAFVAAYDGARKAMTAVLAAQGLRAAAGEGGHTVLLDALRSQFPDDREVLQQFDWMRATRNATAYPDSDHPTATRADVVEAVPAATAIIDLAVRFLDLP
ncbi:HEPN domain-containing protein [Cellulomonas triticagri]|uniref:HEPN domain-containing protein n=1 Tax=Cellulomonas triticagri TaxID=2483352 RepID=UPI0011C49D85|nr:HEPN domain-containing protein [Cellulomonas triticagri]